jgi:hypothetical protein
MNEVAAPLQQHERARLRFNRLVELHAQADRLALQIRQELAALVDEDTPMADRAFCPDELSLAFAESTGTCKRWVDEARMTVDRPRVMALVADGTWSMRHADAVLGELGGAREETQQAVLDLVLADASARTPHQLRKATRAALLLHDLEGAKDKQDAIHANRGVALVDEFDGSSTLLVNGTKTGGAAMLAAIDAHVAVAAPGDTRSLAARRYDFVMDLLCGRTAVTAPWQALIVVSLETLEGGDAPAEIPGLGLVTAEEAREALASAELRRALVDEHGVLVSLDDVVHVGDQEPLVVVRPAEVVDDEPAEIHVEELATVEERAWLAAQEEGDLAEEAFESARAERREQQLLWLCDRGMAAIEAHLDAEALAPVGGPVDWPTFTDHRPPDDDADGGSAAPPPGPPRPSPFRPGGDGQGTPPDGPPPQDEPPTWADRDWLEIQEDRDGSHDLLDKLAHASSGSVLRPTREPTAAPSAVAQQRREERVGRQAVVSRWTTEGLRATVTDLRTSPPTPVPPASKGYPFRGRLARWIRSRDISCTFPGCQLLARRCEVDHVVEYPKGPTEHGNGACECVHHHQCKHAVMQVARLADGTMRWTSRFGTTVARPPRPLLRGW